MPEPAPSRPVFVLPDRLCDLIPEEERLLREFLDIEGRYVLLKKALPVGTAAMKTSLFFSLMVAHRKWLFAREKLRRLAPSKA